MTTITSSKYAMLQGIVELAWVDGKVTDEECARLNDFLDSTQFITDSQRDSLKARLNTKHELDIDAIWEQITNKEDRAALLDIALSIFHADGEFCDTEREVYERLRASHMASIDLNALNQDLSQMAAEAAARREAEEAAYIATFKNDGGFPIPGVNKAEMLVYKLDKFLGNK